MIIESTKNYHKDFIFSGNTWLTAGLIAGVIFMIAGLRGYAVTGGEDSGDVTPEAAISDVSKKLMRSRSL